MKELGYSANEEEKFVKSLFTNFWKKFDQKDEEGRAKAKSPVAFGQVMFLLVFTFTVGLGYVFKALSSYFNFKPRDSTRLTQKGKKIKKINYRHRLTQIDTDEKINAVKNSLVQQKKKSV